MERAPLSSWDIAIHQYNIICSPSLSLSWCILDSQFKMPFEEKLFLHRWNRDWITLIRDDQIYSHFKSADWVLVTFRCVDKLVRELAKGCLYNYIGKKEQRFIGFLILFPWQFNLKRLRLVQNLLHQPHFNLNENYFYSFFFQYQMDISPITAVDNTSHPVDSIVSLYDQSSHHSKSVIFQMNLLAIQLLLSPIDFGTRVIVKSL